MEKEKEQQSDSGMVKEPYEQLAAGVLCAECYRHGVPPTKAGSNANNKLGSISLLRAFDKTTRLYKNVGATGGSSKQIVVSTPTRTRHFIIHLFAYRIGETDAVAERADLDEMAVGDSS